MGYLSSSNTLNNWVTVSGLNISYGQWHHLAITYDGNSPDPTQNILRFYIDGVEHGAFQADLDVASSLTVIVTC